MIVKINLNIILILFGLISDIVLATKEEYRTSSPLKVVDRIDEVTEINHGTAKQAQYSMQMKQDDVEELRSNIKDSSSGNDNYFETMHHSPTTQSTEFPEENKSLSSYRTQEDISDKKDLPKNQPQFVQGIQYFTEQKNAIEQDQQQIYSIKLPNQHFHNQAMQLNADYQGYITHDSPSYVQHPNRHLSEATQLHFGNSIPSNFGAHFEALTQNKEKPMDYSIREIHHHNTPSQIKALSGNYYNTNVQHHDNHQTYEPQNYHQNSNLHDGYRSNVQYHDQSQDGYNPNIRHNDKSSQYGLSVTHHGKTQQYVPNSFFHDENNQMPHFEAFTGDHPHNNHPTTSDYADGYKKHKTHFNNESESKNSHHNKKKSEENHHSLPDQTVLLNHKVYHDDNYQRAENDKHISRPEIHQSYRAGILKPSQAIMFNDKGFNSQVGRNIHNNKPKKQQKNSRHHRKHGHAYNKNGYLNIEHPQESQISEKNILPSPSIPKPDKIKQKLYINVEDDTINRKQLNDHKINKSHAHSRNTKSKVLQNQGKNKTIETEFDDEFKENNNRDIVKPVHEDFDERDASPKEITNDIRYFQDIYLAHNSPHETEFGHVLETPDKVEERFESNDRKNHRYKGKIQWINKNGEYGQQFWDLGHLGGR